MSSKSAKIVVKRGDDFRLDMTVQDLNNDTAIAAASALEAAQLAYAAAVNADPQIPEDITATNTALLDAQAAYDAAITVDITDWVITAKMAWVGKLVSTFEVVLIDPMNGTFSIRLGNADTALWKPRVYEADIQFVRPEGKVSSETFLIAVERDVTNG